MKVEQSTFLADYIFIRRILTSRQTKGSQKSGQKHNNKTTTRAIEHPPISFLVRVVISSSQKGQVMRHGLFPAVVDIVTNLVVVVVVVVAAGLAVEDALTGTATATGIAVTLPVATDANVCVATATGIVTSGLLAGTPFSDAIVKVQLQFLS